MSDRRVFILEAAPPENGPIVAVTIFNGSSKAEIQRVFWNAYLTFMNAAKEPTNED